MPTYTRVLLDQATLPTGDAPLFHLRHGPTAAALILGGGPAFTGTWGP